MDEVRRPFDVTSKGLLASSETRSRLDNFLGPQVFLPFAFYSLKTEIVNYVDILPQR